MRKFTLREAKALTRRRPVKIRLHSISIVWYPRPYIYIRTKQSAIFESNKNIWWRKLRDLVRHKLNWDFVECRMTKWRHILRKSFWCRMVFAKLKTSFAVSFPLMALSEIFVDLWIYFWQCLKQDISALRFRGKNRCLEWKIWF